MVIASCVATTTGAVTVRLAEPVLPSLVATTDADPGATPVTTPFDATVATAVFELDHVTARPVRTLPAESFVTAVACVVPPVVRLELASVTDTLATGFTTTVTLAVPALPSLVAVIVAEPAATAVTMPVAATVATPVFELDHVTARPVSTLPAESFVTAVA